MPPKFGLSLMPYLQVMCFSLFLFSLPLSAQLKSSNSISLGSSLSPNTTRSSWPSPSGLFAFGFYEEGNGFAVGIWLDDKSNITVVWTANRDNPKVSLDSTIEFTIHGELLLRTGHGDDQNQKSLVDLSDPAVSASMLDSGNFVIYGNDSESEAIWESFKNPTDTILGGQNITSTILTSSKSTFDHSSGRFHLELTNTGDLVAHPVNHTGAPEEFYWEILAGAYPLKLNLSPGGVLQVSNYDKTIKIIAKSSYRMRNHESVIYRATLDPGGILRLYSHRFKITGIISSNVTTEWSALKNQCEVKGFCGFNSFCSSNSSKADCYCFPGFDFINSKMRFLGCYRIFNDEEGCKREEPVMFYNISKMGNTKLGGLPYAKLALNKEDCSKSCLYDCYCGAAFYLNKTCKKLKLPLMFGMEDHNEPASTVFVKWSPRNTNLRIPRISPPILHETVVIDSKKKLVTILAASLGSIMFLCFLIAVSSFLVYRFRVTRYRKLPENSDLGLTEEFTAQSFTYSELEDATDGFKEELGRGCFEAVYKGTLREGNKMIVVKRFDSSSMEEGGRKFREEIAAVRQTHHRNLVRLLGFCVENSKKLLVYEYMNNGSLSDLIFNVERRPLWKERVRIALEVARGIHYLHEECEVPIIHCDIKPRSILLDDSWTAKISNFGLAKRLMPNQNGIVGVVRESATGNYMASEWQKNGLITAKSDVYSFGVMLLEIICCRRNVEVNVSSDEILLSTLVYNLFIARVLNKLVAEDGGQADMKTLERMVKVGLLCIQDDPSVRPSMKNVILMLEGTMNIPVPPFPSPSLVIT